MNFEVLEISNRDEGEQSTGVIIHIPNLINNLSGTYRFLGKSIDEELSPIIYQ